MSTNYEAPHCATSPFSCYFISLRKIMEREGEERKKKRKKRATEENRDGKKEGMK
jgi:hypothetical protein